MSVMICDTDSGGTETWHAGDIAQALAEPEFSKLHATISGHKHVEGQNMKRTFDWDECARQHRPAYVAWLKANHDKPTKEAAYIEAYQGQRSSDNRPKKARRYATAKLKGSYRRLREAFGFFA